MMATTKNGDNSVVFSLTELVKLEETRVRDEEAERARARETEQRAARAAALEAREREAAAIARDAEAQQQRAIDAARERARLEARELAAVEVARIEAAGRVRIEEESAARAHELALLRTRTESTGRRREMVLATLLGLVVLGAGVLGFASQRSITRLDHENQQLRRGQITLTEERDHARANELAALGRLQRVEVVEKLPIGDGRVRESLEPPVRGNGVRGPKAPAPARPKCTNPADPLCGLDGRAL